eukprot:gene9441-12721_t
MNSNEVQASNIERNDIVLLKHHSIKTATSINKRSFRKNSVYDRFDDIGYLPFEVAKLYEFPEKLIAKKKVGIIGFNGLFDRREIKKYWTDYCNIKYEDLPVIKVVYLYPYDMIKYEIFGTPNYNLENAIDIETIGCIIGSTNLEIIFYYGGDNGSLFEIFEIFERAIYDNENKLDVISFSWGIPEEFIGKQYVNEFDKLFQDAVAKNINIVVSSGDTGSSDGIIDSSIHVDFPSSSPNVISCGGTSLHAAKLLYDEDTVETLWSFNLTERYNLASGGGYSVYFDKPEYQNLINNSTKRSVPDVVLNSNTRTGMYILFNNQLVLCGGTSIAAPTFSSFLLLSDVNEFVLPLLYQQQESFHKITSGTNGFYSLDSDSNKQNNIVGGLGSPIGSRLLKK